MSDKFPIEPWSNWNKARLEELRVANGNHLFSQIDILEGQAQRLADPRAALANAFRRYTISSYAANFDSYSGQKFQVQPDPRRLSSGGVVLRTQIVRASGSPVEIDYVMRQTSAGWKAVDVLADGAISRVAVQRSDFTTLLQRGGVLALEHGLEHKVATLSNGSAT